MPRRKGNQERRNVSESALTDKILHCYNTRDPALPDYIDSLDTQQIEELILYFEHLARQGTLFKPIRTFTKVIRS